MVPGAARSEVPEGHHRPGQGPAPPPAGSSSSAFPPERKSTALCPRTRPGPGQATHPHTGEAAPHPVPAALRQCQCLKGLMPVPGKRQESHYYQQRRAWLGWWELLRTRPPWPAWRRPRTQGQRRDCRQHDRQAPPQCRMLCDAPHRCWLPPAEFGGVSGVREGCWSGGPGSCQVQGHVPPRICSVTPCQSCKG